MVTPHIGSRQIGFKSNWLDQNVRILTDLGYKVALCEQKENRFLMAKRLKKNKKGGKGESETESDESEESTKDNDDENVPEEMKALKEMKKV